MIISAIEIAAKRINGFFEYKIIIKNLKTLSAMIKEISTQRHFMATKRQDNYIA